MGIVECDRAGVETMTSSIEALRNNAKRVTQELFEVAPQTFHTARLYDVQQCESQHAAVGRSQVMQQIATAASTTIAYDMHGQGGHRDYILRGFREYDARYGTRMGDRKIAFTRYTEPQVIVKALCEPSLQEHDVLGNEEARSMQRAVSMLFMSLMSDNTLATVHTALANVFDQITWNYTAWMDYSKTIQAVREWLLATLDTAIHDTVTEVEVPWEWRKPILVERFLKLLTADTLDQILQYHKMLQHTGMANSTRLSLSNISMI